MGGLWVSGCMVGKPLIATNERPAATTFQFYDPDFKNNNAGALASSKLSTLDLYYYKSVPTGAVGFKKKYRHILDNFNWGPFYGSTIDTLYTNRRDTLYHYLKFYADGRLALFYVSNPPDKVQLGNPVDNIGYYRVKQDTAEFELVSRFDPATRVTGTIVFYTDSVRMKMTFPRKSDKTELHTYYKYTQ
jgi:hypothetical protein